VGVPIIFAYGTTVPPTNAALGCYGWYNPYYHSFFSFFSATTVPNLLLSKHLGGCGIGWLWI